MSKAGKKIIAGLKDALAYAKGDKSKGTTRYIIRCGCCNKVFNTLDRKAIFCPKCEGKPE